MAKQAYVYSGTDWVPLASEVTNLSNYQLSSGTGLNTIIPTSVAVGSGSGSVSAIGVVTFSGASSVSINDCFNSTYDNYKIIFKLSGVTADGVVYVKLRASGTDSSVNYYWGLYGVVAGSSTAIVNNASNVSNGFLVMEDDTGSSAKPTFAEMTFLNPKVAEPTSMIGQNISSTNAGTPVGINIWGLHTPSTSYDGLTFVPTAGNISGTISVYGYKD
jgi:hypothetical protein